MAKNPPRISIVAGWTPTDARPVFLARPYRILNPPGVLGKAKIGLPPTTSSMNMNSFASSPSAEELFSDRSHSHPSRPRRSTILRTFCERPRSPSFTTRSAPPRTRFVSTLRTFRLTVTSTGSVSTPFGSIGSLSIASCKASSELRYWNLATARS